MQTNVKDWGGAVTYLRLSRRVIRNSKIMDYKYINQLLDRYWQGLTSVEEEHILHAFFSQESIPAELKPYQLLFAYEAKETTDDVLGEDFDRKLMAKIADQKTVKARVIPLSQRLRPIFKAAAMVAIVLTLGNAIQVPFGHQHDSDAISNYDGYYKPELDKGTNVAIGDSAAIDTMKQGLIVPDNNAGDAIVK